MARASHKSRRPRKGDIKSAVDRAEKRSKGEAPSEPKTKIDPDIVTAAEIRDRGRPTAYKPEYAAVAKALCKRGATDYELAQEFGVTTVTIWRWQGKHADFCNALKIEKAAYDDRVERSLAQRAIGYTYDSEKVFNSNGEILRADIVEHIPPDPGAAKLWLTNRRREDWADTSRHEHTGRNGGPIETVGEVDKLVLARWIAFQFTSVQDADVVH